MVEKTENIGSENGTNNMDSLEWLHNKMQEKSQAYDYISRQTDKIVSSKEDMVKFFDILSVFGNYSVNNALLIMAQKPDATHVYSFEKWNYMRTQIKKGEKGIMLLAPGNEFQRSDGTKGREIKVIKAFDISQTDCSLNYRKKDDYSPVMVLSSLVSVSGKEIILDKHIQVKVGARYDENEDVIRLREDLGPEKSVPFVIRELARLRLQNENTFLNKDFLANGAAYIATKKFGMDTSVVEPKELPDDMRSHAERTIKNDLNIMKKIAYDITTNMSQVIEDMSQKKEIKPVLIEGPLAEDEKSICEDVFAR